MYEHILHYSTHFNISMYFTEKKSMKHTCQFHTNKEAGIIILTSTAICFLKESDTTTLLWSTDYIV